VLVLRWGVFWVGLLDVLQGFDGCCWGLRICVSWWWIEGDEGCVGVAREWG
jgi:hypothetical protein